MTRPVRIIVIFFAIVALLMVAAALVMPRLLDPGVYKPQIIAEIKARTGRELVLDGDITVSVFPWLGLELGSARLGNAPGFGDTPFASVAAIDVRVKLLPLLRKQIEMRTVRLEGLRLNLARDAQGRDNWSDLSPAKGEAKEETAEQSQAGAGAAQIAAFAIGGIDLKDAQVSWHDLQTGSDYRLEGLDLTTGPLNSGREVDMALSFQLLSRSSRLDERIDLSARVQGEPQQRRYLARHLKLAWTRAGSGTPAELSGDLDIALGAQTLNFTDVKLQVAGLAAQGNLRGQRLFDAPGFSGEWQVAGFSPRSLLENLAVPVPETADPAVLGQASANFTVTADDKSVRLAPLVLQLDDTRLDGELTVSEFAKARIDFKAVVDSLDLDRYLPPPAAAGEAGTPAGPAEVAGGGVAGLPLDTLRALNLSGELRIGSLKAYGLRSANVNLTVSARDGDLRVNPASADLYQGRYQGNIGLHATAREARLSLNERFTGIQVGEMLNDLQGRQRLSGTGDMNFRLTSRGADVPALRRHLNGTAAFNFRDGAVEGIDIGRLVSQAQATLKGQSLKSGVGADRTDFSELSGTVTFTGGVAHNRDLVGKSPFLRVTGAGTADLARAEMDYLLKVVIVGTGKGQGGAGLEDLEGVPIPLRIRGPFASLSYDVDLQSALQDVAQAKVGEKLHEKLGRSLGEKFKRLFGR